MAEEIAFEDGRFPTIKGSWTWPWVGSYCIPFQHHASLIDLYIHAKLHWNQRIFLRTNRSTTDIWDRFY